MGYPLAIESSDLDISMVAILTVLDSHVCCRSPDRQQRERRSADHCNYQGMFRALKHAEKVDSGFRRILSALHRESQSKSGIDFLEMNRSKQPL